MEEATLYAGATPREKNDTKTQPWSELRSWISWFAQLMSLASPVENLGGDLAQEVLEVNIIEVVHGAKRTAFIIFK